MTGDDEGPMIGIRQCLSWNCVVYVGDVNERCISGVVKWKETAINVINVSFFVYNASCVDNAYICAFAIVHDS